jgi:hypothetical protein
LTQFVVGDHVYQSDKIGAIDQFNISRRLTPVVLGVAPLINLGSTPEEIAASIGSDLTKYVGLMAPTLEALSKMSDEDVQYVLSKTLSKVQRGVKDPVTGAVVAWSPLWGSGGLQYEDLSMPDMVRIVWNVLSEQLGGFFSESPSGSSG